MIVEQRSTTISITLLDSLNLLLTILLLLIPIVNIISEDIDRHPAKTAQEGDNVSIACSKTPGTISEWKLSSLKQSNSLEVLYINSINGTNVTNIHLEEGSINQVGLQTFSISLINVDINMTGTAIQCGARRNRMSSSRTLFYHQAAVLIVKGLH